MRLSYPLFLTRVTEKYDIFLAKLMNCEYFYKLDLSLVPEREGF